MYRVRFEGKQRFASRLQFEFPSILVQFRHDPEPRPHSLHSARPPAAPPPALGPRPPSTQLQVKVSFLQLNLGTYVLVSKMLMSHRMIRVSCRILVIMWRPRVSWGSWVLPPPHMIGGRPLLNEPLF